MTWLALALALIRLASALLDHAARAGAIAEGEARAATKALEETNARIEKARRARADADAGGLRDDDGYRRD